MSGPGARGRLAVALAVALAALVVGFGALSAWRQVESFQPLGFALAGGPDAGQVAAAAAATGLRAGDQIVLVNDRSLAALDDLGAELRRRPESRLAVVRDGELASITYRLPPPRIDVVYLVLAAIGLGYLLIGFYTLLRDRRPVAYLFYLWCLASAALYLVSIRGSFDLAGRGAYMLEELARILVAPLTLHLFTVFPRPLGRDSAWRRGTPFIYLPAVFLGLLQVDLMFFDGRWLFAGDIATALPMLDRLELFHLVLFALAAAAVLTWRLTRSRQLEAQRQSLWIALGVTAGYLPFVFFYLVPRMLDIATPAAWNAFAVAPLSLVPVTFAYAILRYKLWDIGVIVRNTVSLSATVLVGVIGFALANLAVNRMVPEGAVLGRNLLVFLSGLTIAGLLVPTRRTFDHSLERLQYRSRFGRRRALVALGRELLSERDLERLAERLCDELDWSLDLHPANLLLGRGDALVATRRQTDLPAFLPAADLGADFWSEEVTSLSGIEVPTGAPSAAQRLHAAGYRYAFPLVVRDERLGAVVTGYKQAEIPLSSDDLDLLRGLFNQVALALENARLLTEVRHQLGEVERLERFNEGIIQSSPAGMAVLDREGRVVSANAALAELVGLDGEALAGRRLAELLPIEPLPEPSEGIREASFTDAAGRDRYLQLSAAPFETTAGDGYRVLVVQDVSERVAMEEALKKKDRLASLGMLAAGVAHEVNTPITGISSYAQMLLAETPAEDPRHALLQKVETQTFRAARIVNNLLDFARDRSDEMVALDIAHSVSETLELLRERLAELGVRVAWQPPAEPLLVRANDSELQQVLTNLILNGADAMSGREGELTIDVEAVGRWVAIGIEDRGPGISPADLGRIFEPFYSTKHDKGGTGLGLSISYSIVQRHGGDIRVISDPGRGCRFVVELPRYRPETSPAAG